MSLPTLNTTSRLLRSSSVSTLQSFPIGGSLILAKYVGTVQNPNKFSMIALDSGYTTLPPVALSRSFPSPSVGSRTNSLSVNRHVYTAHSGYASSLRRLDDNGTTTPGYVPSTVPSGRNWDAYSPSPAPGTWDGATRKEEGGAESFPRGRSKYASSARYEIPAEDIWRVTEDGSGRARRIHSDGDEYWRNVGEHRSGEARRLTASALLLAPLLGGRRRILWNASHGNNRRAKVIV
mmetsp:Transcript_14627/g.42882  ORF Transcript_14627/g.42882 Transcript_14627/m.42882 type:complete len:235 (+) Transcript_14627:182-886(+)